MNTKTIKAKIDKLSFNEQVWKTDPKWVLQEEDIAEVTKEDMVFKSSVWTLKPGQIVLIDYTKSNTHPMNDEPFNYKKKGKVLGFTGTDGRICNFEVGPGLFVYIDGLIDGWAVL